MTGTIAVVLLEKAVENITDIASGEAEDVTFEAWPTAIMIFTVVLKFILAISCWITAVKAPQSSQALLAYRDDHRNDTMTNSVGLIGALLASNLKGMWSLCDPIASSMLAVYIFINWAAKIIENMKNLAGKRIE